MAPFSGDYGVGCKKIWSNQEENFIFVFYPTDRKGYDVAMKNESEKMPWNHFDERGKEGFGRAMKQLAGMGANNYFDGLRVPVWLNAPPADIENFVPMIYWHGFFS